MIPLHPIEGAQQMVAALGRLRDVFPCDPTLIEAARIELTSGRLHDAVVEAAMAFDTGADDTGAIEQWVALALRARLFLDDLAFDNDDALVAISQIDEWLRPYKSAVLLLDEATYYDLTNGWVVDNDEWWGGS